MDGRIYSVTGDFTWQVINLWEKTQTSSKFTMVSRQQTGLQSCMVRIIEFYMCFYHDIGHLKISLEFIWHMRKKLMTE